MLFASIGPIAYHLPEAFNTNEQLAAQYPEWSAEKIGAKTGIDRRHIAAPDETASDLAFAAAQKLFDQGVEPKEIDYVLLCTQSPDYALPTTACLLQHRLGVPTTAGALDFNLGCSGFVAGLGLAKGLIESDQAKRILLLTAETYSKFMADDDRGVRTIFGDGAAATLIEAKNSEGLGQFVYGTDGEGAGKLMVEGGGARYPKMGMRLCMEGPSIFAFTLDQVPPAVDALLKKVGLTKDEIDLFIPHQANAFMLESIRKKMGVLTERFLVDLEEGGNTVSATIPIAIARARARGVLRPNMKIVLVGFGVGLSWAACLWRT